MTTSNEALEKRGFSGIARPNYIKEGRRGTENITKDDVRPPALILAQSTSPQAKRSEPQYIDGLREGELFNSITNEIYGEGPVRFIVVNYLGRRNIEFDPNDRKVVLDGNVPDDDPRCSFQMVNGVKTKPRATTFKDFLIRLVHGGARESEVMTLTLKGTQLKKSKRFMSQIEFSKLDSFAFLVEGTVTPEKNAVNSWWGWQFNIVGYPSEQDYALAEQDYGRFQGKTTSELVRDEAASEANSDVPDEDIPF